MFFSNSPQQFRKIISDQLGYQKFPQKNYVLYKNPNNSSVGNWRLYQRKGFYDFALTEYYFPHNFTIQFDAPEPILRFGIVFVLPKQFRTKNQSLSALRPYPFLIYQKNLKGRQHYEKGNSLCSVEISLYQAFFQEFSSRFGQFNPQDYFMKNHSYIYLPEGVHAVIQRLLHLDQTDSLNEILLEAAMIECMGNIIAIGKPNDVSLFSPSSDFGSIDIGEGRKLRFNGRDFLAVKQAYEILTENFVAPPTINALSKQLMISPQKLNSAFSYYFHMTIGTYITNLRMDKAATLLCTTEKSIAEIAIETGYQYPSNFIRKFQDFYGCTPLQYRFREKSRDNQLFLI